MPEYGAIKARYPNSGEVPDIPKFFLDTAQDLSRILDPVATVADLPAAGNWDGREKVVLSVPGARWRWDGAAWSMQGTAYFSNAAARDSALGLYLHQGMEVMLADTGYYVYDGGSWLQQSPVVVPPAQAALGVASANLTGGTWVNIPSLATITISPTKPLLCQLSLRGWMLSTGAGEIRAGIRVTGATDSTPEQPGWGAAAYVRNGTSAIEQTANAAKVVVLDVGTSVIAGQAYGTAVGRQFNYAMLDVVPIRYV